MTVAPASLACCDLGAQLRAVGRADDDDLGALGDHGGDLGLLVGDAAVGVLHVGLEAGLLEAVVEQFSARTQFSEVFWGSATPIEESFGERLAAGGRRRRWSRSSARPQAVSASAAMAAMLLPFLLYQSFALLGSFL